MSFIIMRTLVKSIHYSTLSELNSAAKEITKDQYRFQDIFKEIVFSAFGNEEHQGLIAERMEFYFSKSPINWAQQLDALVSMFSPGGEVMNGCGGHGLVATADHTMPIDPRVLPKSVLDEFSGSADKQSSMLRSLKRQFGDKYYINSWEWFWVHLAHSMVRCQEPEQRRSASEDQQEDQLYYMLCRNPYLMIARKAMQGSYRKDSYLLERMRGVFELFIIEELLFSTKVRSGRVEAKYQLKSQHLCMLFLLINSRKGKLTGETVQIYQEFFLKATQYYSTITSHSNNKNVKNLIRMWVYLLTRDHSLDSNIIKQLQNANPKDGWYHLARCPFQQWSKAIKKVSLPAKQLQIIINVRKNIYRLLAKHNEWTPSYAFLTTLEQYLEFEDNIYHKSVRKHSEKEDDETIKRAFERILIYLGQNGGNPDRLNQVQDCLNNKYKNRMANELTVNFQQRSSEGKQILSRSSREKSKSISYQSPRIRNVWQHPIQQNEFLIFFEIAFWISKQFDKVIPGHSSRKYPCLNIRIISNPYIFFLCLLVLFILVRAVFF